MTSLDGIRILDLTRILAGPWCTQTPADLGADVIKVERSDRGDDRRSWGPPFLRDNEGRETTDAAYLLCANRNKRSLTCDIASRDGQALVRALVPHCQVFVENVKVCELARWGLGWPSLRTLNPALVYCSATGYGQDGPDRHRAGCDYAVQGRGGLMSVTGERDGATDAGGRPELADDARFATNAARVRERDMLVPLPAAALRQRPRTHWLATLHAAGVPGGPINNLAEVLADLQVQARGMVRTWQHSRWSRLRLVGSPLKLSATSELERRPHRGSASTRRRFWVGCWDWRPPPWRALRDKGVI